VDYATHKWTLAWIVLLAVSGYGEARAAESIAGLLGDWGGLRTILLDHGVDLELSGINEVASNVLGGALRETQDANQVYFGGSLDLDRMLSLPGTSLVFSLTDRSGQSLSTKAGLNTLLEVQEIYGEGDYVRLNQLYWRQQLFDKRVELKFGRLTGTFDFMPFSCNFQNITFCATLPSHNVVAHWTAFPGSTWAGIVRVALKEDWYLQSGVYEINPDFAEYRYRFAFGTPFAGLGERVVTEVGWLPRSAGSDGGYRLGTWYDNVGGNDLYLNAAGEPLVTNGGTPLQRHHEAGFYAMAQQQVWGQGGSASHGLSLFINFVQTDHDITKIEQIAEVGLFWAAPLSARPQDDLGIAFGRVRVNSKIADSEVVYDAQVASLLSLPPESVQRAEYPLEIYYSVKVTPVITIRPNIQLIRSPGGVDDRANVLVLGLHSSVNF
jgi:porin